MGARQSGIHFFATRADIESGLDAVERLVQFHYVLAGLFDGPEIQRFETYRDLPQLGESVSGNTIERPSYLLILPEKALRAKEIPQRRGGAKFSISSQGNEDFLLGFSPGGMYQNCCLIPGLYRPGNTRIYDLFRRNFSRHWRSIQSFRVGPEAETLWKNGIPLTPSHTADRSYHLADNVR